MRISDWSSDVCSSDLKASNSASRMSMSSSTRSCQMPLPSRNGGSPKKAPIVVRRIVAFGSRPASMPSPNQGRNESTSESEDPPEPQSDGTIRLSFLWHIRVGALSIWKTIAGSFHELVYLAVHSFGHLAIRSEERRVGKAWVSTCRSRWLAE